MRNGVIILAVVVLLLVFFNVRLLYKYKQNEDKWLAASQIGMKPASESNADAEMSIYRLKECIMLQQMSEATPFGEVEINNSKENTRVRVKDLLQGNMPLLFMRVKETDCDACVQTTTRQLRDMSAHFPQNGVIVLGGHKNVRQFNAFAQTFAGNFRVMNVNVLPVAAENQDQPYFFIVTPDQKIQNLFIVNKEDSQLTTEYLHSMGHKYWDMHIGDHNHGNYPAVYD